MRAVGIPVPGGPDALVLVERPRPVPLAHEVLLEVEYAGVNRADAGQRAGRYPPPAGASPIPGLECSGRVVEVGEAVTGWRVGDGACALLTGGGYAEYVAVPEGQLLPIPRGIDMAGAAALPEAACTVYSNLHDLVPGESSTVLIHGGSSGIGTFAIQWLSALGVTVHCTVGSAAKADYCRGLGAAHVINYRDESFEEAVARETGQRGLDIVLDIVGGPYLAANLRALAAEGHLVIIGTQGGSVAEVDLKQLLRKRLTMRASTLRARSDQAKAAIVAGVRRDVWPLVGDGRIRPHIDRVFPLADAASAHRLLESSAHMGKLLLAP